MERTRKIADIPGSTRNMRACTTCGLVKSKEQFSSYGCDNCSKDFETTTAFEGIIALVEPQKSWVARHKGIDKRCVPGIYAFSIQAARY